MLLLIEAREAERPCLTAWGHLNHHTSRTLLGRVERLLRQGHARIELDLAEISSLDATGLGTLIASFWASRAHQARLILRQASRPVLEALAGVQVACFQN